jgi:hypothetical protein
LLAPTWAHVEVPDRDLILVRRGQHGLDQAAARRAQPKQNIANGERLHARLPDVQHCANVGIGEQIGEIQRDGREQDDHDRTARGGGDARNQFRLRGRKRDIVRVLALARQRQVGADGEDDLRMRGQMNQLRDQTHI